MSSILPTTAKKFSRKDAKLAKKGKIMGLKPGPKISFASGACPRMNQSGTALRETLFGVLSWFRLVRVRILDADKERDTLRTFI